jgi:hypothetical protein
MAKIWFSGFHTGNTVKSIIANTVGQLIANESLDMNGATIVLSRTGGGERKVTDYDTVLADGDVVTVQKSSVKSGSPCRAWMDVPVPTKPKEEIPRLMKDDDGQVVLVNRDIWNSTSVFSGTVVVNKSNELGYNGMFLKGRYTPYYGKVVIEYTR